MHTFFSLRKVSACCACRQELPSGSCWGWKCPLHIISKKSQGQPEAKWLTTASTLSLGNQFFRDCHYSLFTTQNYLEAYFSLITGYSTIVSYTSEASSTRTKHSSCKNTWLDLSVAIWSSKFPFSFLCFSSKHFARCWHISAVDANLRWSWWVSSVSDRHRTSLVAWAFSRSAKLFWSRKISLSFSYGGWFIIFSISVFFSSSCWFNFCTS